MNQPKTNDLQAQLAKLFNRINYERKTGLKAFDFKLDGIQQLLELLGNPHLKCPVIHVAGTKGKGSVAKMTGAILSEAGYRTGVYTSPHLESINQRIAVDNAWISDDDLAKTLAEIEPAVNEVDQQSELANIRPLTFFEVITTAAFQYFANVGCEAVVLEVGMGGRLDSTNVCQPEVCVITNINFDHTKQLGNTLEKIAGEKAGIIKPGVPVVCGVTKRKPREVIHKIAAANQAELWQLDKQFAATCQPHVRGMTLDTWGRTQNDGELDWSLENIELALLGKHQATNAAVAIATIQRLIKNGWTIKDDYIKSALAKLKIPGRAEIARDNPPVVLDIAHNVVSIEALIQTLGEHFPKWNQARKKRLILAISKDKDHRGILRWLVDTFDEIILTKFQSNPRGKRIEDLLEEAEVMREGLKTETLIRSAKTPESAWELLQADLADDDFVCITGSVFLVAELRATIGQTT